MSTHPFTPEEIMAFVDGELFAGRAQPVSAHVETCAECQEVMASLRGTSRALSNWTAESFPARLEKWVLDESHATSIVSEEGFISKLRRFSRLSPALTATAATFVLGLVLIGLSARRMEKRTSMDYVAKQQVAEKQGSLGKLEPIVPPASRSTRAGIPHGYAGDSVDLAEAEESKVASSPPPPPPPPNRRELEPRSLPMIVRTISLSIVVKEFDAARASLDAILARHNGYSATLNAVTPQGAARTIQASLRIPAPQLAAAAAELKALGRVENETQNGEEVTQQHADLVARLKNSRETEQRLEDVLRTRTGKVKDVLEVEEEIARVRGEIEQMEAEQQTLEHRVNFATIDLKLAEEYKAQLSSPAPSVGIQLRNATVNGFRNASETLLAILLFVAESGPTLLLWLLILLFPARLIWRRYQRQLAMS
jgi:hypothetical protein